MILRLCHSLEYWSHKQRDPPSLSFIRVLESQATGSPKTAYSSYGWMFCPYCLYWRVLYESLPVFPIETSPGFIFVILLNKKESPLPKTLPLLLVLAPSIRNSTLLLSLLSFFSVSTFFLLSHFSRSSHFLAFLYVLVFSLSSLFAFFIYSKNTLSYS